MERILAQVPVLGKARRNLAIARLSIALEALLWNWDGYVIGQLPG